MKTCRSQPELARGQPAQHSGGANTQLALVCVDIPLGSSEKKMKLLARVVQTFPKKHFPCYKTCLEQPSSRVCFLNWGIYSQPDRGLGYKEIICDTCYWMKGNQQQWAGPVWDWYDLFPTTGSKSILKGQQVCCREPWVVFPVQFLPPSLCCKEDLLLNVSKYC